MIPDWLPAQLNLTGSPLQVNIDKLHAVYESDLVKAPASTVDGSPVYVNSFLDPAWNREYTYGFTHLITQGKGVRTIDYNRASRLPWVKAVLDNYMEPEVFSFWDHSSKGDKLYLWLKGLDYIVILNPKDDDYIVPGQKRMIASAYLITENWRRREFEKKYARSFRRL